MYFVITAVCALAYLAVVSAVVASRMSDVKEALALMAKEMDAIRVHPDVAFERNLSAKALIAEVDSLRGVVDSARAANRREFGKVWGHLSQRTNDRVLPGGVTIDDVIDPELENMLRLQSAPVPK